MPLARGRQHTSGPCSCIYLVMLVFLYLLLGIFQLL